MLPGSLKPPSKDTSARTSALLSAAALLPPPAAGALAPGACKPVACSQNGPGFLVKHIDPPARLQK